MTAWHRCGAIVLSVAIAAVSTACADADSPEPAAPATTTTVASSEDAYGAEVDAGIDPLIGSRFSEAVGALGLRITRAARYEELGSEEPVADGRHLAVYVEPVGASAPAAFLDRIPSLADAFLPEVFDEYPGLESMDVCQEPPPGVGDDPTPEAYTQLLATRPQAAAIDWPNVTLPELVRASLAHPNRIGLAVGEPVAATSEWRRLEEDAMSDLGESG